VTTLPRLVGDLGGAVRAAVEERCPILALPSSWDAYLAGLSGKHRHELTRKLRRMEREAPEVHAVSVGEPAAVRARLNDFLRLHRSSRVGKAKFMDERMEDFFREVTTALAGRGMLRLWFLEAAGGAIASFITLEWEGTVGLYNSGFEPSRAALSPGLILLAHVIRDAIARGMTRFDFLRGEERYKYEFGPTPEDVYRVRIA
jgi:CelD/BcsL family acetyltransferase involved in cellulose biosynthesis